MAASPFFKIKCGVKTKSYLLNYGIKFNCTSIIENIGHYVLQCAYAYVCNVCLNVRVEGAARIM